MRLSTLIIQAYCRGEVARRVFECKRREAASLLIQKESRKYLARKSYIAFCSSAITIQRGMRGMAARNQLRFRKQTKAAILIQCQYRRHIARQKYTRMRKAAIATQCAWRVKLARRELRKLKMAAKETGALQEAKNKLEKQVEELTWRLQLEKRLRADLDETRKQENSKLQLALEEMQKQCQETKTLFMKEREENVKKTAELVPFIQEVPVVDNDFVKKLSEENDQLKELVSSLEKKIDEVEKKFEDTSKLGEERIKQAQSAESKIIQLKTTIQRLEEKIADMETEEHILRQQSLISSSRRISDNQEIQSGTPRRNFGTESLRKSQMERQRELSDSLIKCVAGDVGFSQGKPVAAFTMYKCLLHWKSFEAERTNVFDRLIQLIGSAIENSDDNCHLAYWLSNTSTLLFLLQRSLKASRDWKPPQPTSFFGRMAQGFRSSSANIQVDIARPVEAKYPALLFKQQLTAYVEKIFGIIRDNFKKEISPLLSSCIQAPKKSQGGTSLRRSLSNVPVVDHWRDISDNLYIFLDIMKENHVPKNLAQSIFTQIFSFINVQLFNSLLLRRECCTFSNGEYVKAGLDKLEAWCQEAAEFAGSSWDELKHIRQAVGFLVIHQKSRITLDDITNDLCPLLSVQQLYRICTLYWDDSYNTRSVSPEVISNMRALMSGENENEKGSDTANNAFLLDDISSIPFSVDELSASQEERDFAGVKAPPNLVENPDFQFLQE